MSALISPADQAFLQSCYGHAEVQPLTQQQERFVLLYFRGLPASQAAEMAGYAPNHHRQLLKQSNVQIMLDFLREREFTDVRVTRDRLTGMLFEAHSKAGSATEEIMAIKELGKLHGLYESDKQRAVQMQVNIQKNVTNIRQIERLSEEDLMAIAGQSVRLDLEHLPEAV